MKPKCEFRNIRPDAKENVILVSAICSGERTLRGLQRDIVISENNVDRSRVFASLNAAWLLHKKTILANTGKIVWLHLEVK